MLSIPHRDPFELNENLPGPSKSNYQAKVADDLLWNEIEKKHNNTVELIAKQ